MIEVSRRVFAGALAITVVMPNTAATAQAPWPEKPIKLVVPFPPGGGADFLGRLLAQKLGESLKQAIVVDNKPGAATTIGADAVAKAAPDGYTLLLLLRDTAINPSLMPALPYDTLKAFSWIGKVAEGPFVLVVNPQVNARTLAEFAALAKAKPGTVSYGSLGVGGMGHISVEAMARHLGINLLHAPYKGAGPALAATVSGEVQATLAALTGAVPFIRDGRLRALAVGADRRAAQLPDVPTVAEAGGGKETVLPQFYAMAAPAGTPAPIVERLSAELKRVLAEPEIIEKMTQGGLTPAFSTPAAFKSEIEADVARFARLVKEIGVTMQ
jgi:tripartite-type tricarboxylate transporter receptor subunit TctC